jgi:hypothetical protein
VVRKLAEAHGLRAVLVADDGDDALGSRSDWVLLSDSNATLDVPAIDEVSEAIDLRPDLPLWTDDFNNIVQVLK